MDLKTLPYHWGKACCRHSWQVLIRDTEAMPTAPWRAVPESSPRKGQDVLFQRLTQRYGVTCVQSEAVNGEGVLPHMR